VKPVRQRAPGIAGGGVFLARGVAETVFEAGQKERVTLIEFESFEKALLAGLAVRTLDPDARPILRVVPQVRRLQGLKHLNPFLQP
jgi:hypothetical protein